MPSLKSFMFPAGERTRAFQAAMTIVYAIDQLERIEGPVETGDLLVVTLNTITVMWFAGWFGRFGVGMWDAFGTWRAPYWKRAEKKFRYELDELY